MLLHHIKMNEENLNIEFEGDLDIEATELIQQVIIPMMGDFTTVNINLGKVPFVDSTGMGLLIELVRSTESSGTKVTISEVKEEIFEVFELLQLPEILGKEVFV
jgi:anti-anti-sigma factor